MHVLTTFLAAIFFLASPTAQVIAQPSFRPSDNTLYYERQGPAIDAWTGAMLMEVQRHWSLPFSMVAAVGHTAILADVDRDGTLLNHRRHVPSGLERFDAAAEQALVRASFGPLPQTYDGDRFTFVIVFWHNELPFDLFHGKSESEVLEIARGPDPPEAKPTDAAPSVSSEREAVAGSDGASVLTFRDGKRMVVSSFSVESGLIQLRTLDGKLQSLPSDAVDLARTEPLGQPAEENTIRILRANTTASFAARPEYLRYVRAMLEQVASNWQRIQAGASAAAVLTLVVWRDGSVSDVRVERSAGSAKLDKEAERALSRSTPLPPLPPSYPSDSVELSMKFDYTSPNEEHDGPAA